MKELESHILENDYFYSRLTDYIENVPPGGGCLDLCLEFSFQNSESNITRI